MITSFGGFDRCCVPTRERLRERVIESPGVFTLSVDLDLQRAGESAQFSSAGIWYNGYAQLCRRRVAPFHHGAAVQEGETPLSAVELACHAFNGNVGHRARARSRAGDHFNMAHAFEVAVPRFVGCEPANVVRFLEVTRFGGHHLDLERTFGLDHVLTLLGRDTQRETYHHCCHCQCHSHIAPEVQVTEFLPHSTRGVYQHCIPKRLK